MATAVDQKRRPLEAGSPAARPEPLRPPTAVGAVIRFSGGVLRAALPFICLIAIWQLTKVVFNLPDRVLASPMAVVREGEDLLRLGVIWEYAANSLLRLIKAALISIAIGVPLGLLIGSSRSAALASERFIQFLLGVSGVAWLPLAIIWLGFTERTVLTVVVYTAVLPIVMSTVHGIRSIPTIYVDCMSTLGASRLRVIWDVYLPGAMTNIIAGIRTGIGYGWRALIGSEMVVSLGGLGFLIFNARSFGQVDQIIVGMVVIGVLFITIDRLLLGPFERLTVGRWTPEGGRL